MDAIKKLYPAPDILRFDRRDGRRDLLDVPHLNGAQFPGRQYLLDALSKKPLTLRYPVAAPSKKKVQLHCLALQIWPVVFGEDGYLGRETDAVLTNSPAQFVQGKLLKFFVRAWANGLDTNLSRHGIHILLIKRYKERIKISDH
jgi:hypothetical protein